MTTTRASEQRCDDANGADYHCGVGTEWAVTERVSIKSEALYLRLQDDSFTRTGQMSGSGDTNFGTDAHVAAATRCGTSTVSLSGR
jgi:opacity protein-like surface antigen